MIRKISIYIAALMSLAACSDDINWDNGSHISPDGTIDFTVSVPQMQVVSTRAASVDENTVSKIGMYIFSGTGEDATLVQSNPDIDFDKSGSDYKFKVLLKKGVNAGDNLNFYFIANLPVTISEGTTLATFRAMTQSVTTDKGLMVMSGKHVGTTNLDGTTISLVRNGAKFTVHDKNDSEDYTDECDYPFDVVNTAESGSIVAGADGILGTAKAAKNVSNFSNDKTDIEYVYPTENSGKGPYVIVKANFNSKPYYYCLTLKDEDGNNMNVNPNHWYKIVISQIKGAGSSTPDGAMENPIDPGENSVADYEIHDHSPAIYNMITDGRRELGVSNMVTYNGNANDYNSTNAYLYVKVLDKDATLSFDDVKNNITITESYDWFDIDTANPVDATNESFKAEGSGTTGTVGGGFPNGDASSNDAGIVLKYKVKFNSTYQMGTQTGSVKVSWEKLSRNVDVVWSRDFNGKDLCEATLYIYDADNSLKETKDYWAWLDGESVDGETLFGVATDENNGKARDAGFHFPVMYGERGKTNEARWHYEYAVTFDKLQEDNFKWYVYFEEGTSATLSGNVSIKVGSSDAPMSVDAAMTHTAGQELKIRISRPGNVYAGSSDGITDYTYGTGKLVFVVIPMSDNSARVEDATDYRFDLYHTGFFHQHTSAGEQHRVDDSDTNNYYYYEVVPVDGVNEGMTRYMLDRNIGAKSAGMYVTSGMSGMAGDDKARGGYYKVAEYKKWGTPEMYSDLTPPGYMVPRQAAWDAIRNSSKFTMNSMGTYFSAQYNTGSAAGTIYFPRVEYYESTTPRGEAMSGYYYTQTPASGLEKDEVGRWLRALSLTGSASSYMNANVEKFAMSVRAINDIDDTSDSHRTSFYVNGATHIYLYTVDNSGNRTPINTWPGKSIGNYQTLGPDKDAWFNFSYESETVSSESLYVVFNYLASDNVIYTVGKNAKGYSINPNEIDGWKVVGDTDNAIKDPSKEDYWGVPTANTYWWKIHPGYTPSTSSYNAGNAKAYCYMSDPRETVKYRYRLYWPTTLGMINLWYIDSSNNKNVIASDKSGTVSSSIRGYSYYEFSNTDSSETLYYGFKNNGSYGGDKTLGAKSTWTYKSNNLYVGYINDSGNGFVSGEPTPKPHSTTAFEAKDKLRIRWKKSSNDTYIWIWEDGGSSHFTSFPGGKAISDGDYYYIDTEIKGDGCVKIHFIRNGGNSDGSNKHKDDTADGGHTFTFSQTDLINGIYVYEVP